MPSGGIRPGSGRPKGQGKFGEKTKPIRIPISMVDSVLTFVQSYDLSLPISTNNCSNVNPLFAESYISFPLSVIVTG